MRAIPAPRPAAYAAPTSSVESEHADEEPADTAAHTPAHPRSRCCLPRFRSGHQPPSSRTLLPSELSAPSPTFRRTTDRSRSPAGRLIEALLNYQVPTRSRSSTTPTSVKLIGGSSSACCFCPTLFVGRGPSSVPTADGHSSKNERSRCPSTSPIPTACSAALGNPPPEMTEACGTARCCPRQWQSSPRLRNRLLEHGPPTTGRFTRMPSGKAERPRTGTPTFGKVSSGKWSRLCAQQPVTSPSRRRYTRSRSSRPGRRSGECRTARRSTGRGRCSARRPQRGRPIIPPNNVRMHIFTVTPRELPRAHHPEKTSTPPPPNSSAVRIFSSRHSDKENHGLLSAQSSRKHCASTRRAGSDWSASSPTREPSGQPPAPCVARVVVTK